MLFMFIRADDITYAEAQLIFQQFVTSSWKIVKNIIKICRSFFLYKINKNMQTKSELKCFVHLQVWQHLRRIQNFITS